jgi:glycosyltransferase involved in cell wall biosynthesis
MAELAKEMGPYFESVIYVANQKVSSDRAKMGWSPSHFADSSLIIAPDRDSASLVAQQAPTDSIHICQGLRGNLVLNSACTILQKRGLRQWIIMETVDDDGFVGFIKRILYRVILSLRSPYIEGILAIGYKTPCWLSARGFPKERIIPFAYFLSDDISKTKRSRFDDSPFRFLFVGNIIELKRLDYLLQALSSLKHFCFELHIVGDGLMRKQWEKLAKTLLPSRVCWHGQMQMNKIYQVMANADCLILPSRFDGWGAVVTESLMVGTPVICSDACGSANVVQSSGVGGVYPVDDIDELSLLLESLITKGALTNMERSKLQHWAKSLGSSSGAKYLSKILQCSLNKQYKHQTPWSLSSL